MRFRPCQHVNFCSESHFMVFSCHHYGLDMAISRGFFFFILSSHGRYCTHAHFFFQCVLKVLKGCVFRLFFLIFLGRFCTDAHFFFQCVLKGCVFGPYIILFFVVFFLVRALQMFFPLNSTFVDQMWGMFWNFQTHNVFINLFFLCPLTACSVSMWYLFRALHSISIVIPRSYFHVWHDIMSQVTLVFPPYSEEKLHPEVSSIV